MKSPLNPIRYNSWYWVNITYDRDDLYYILTSCVLSVQGYKNLKLKVIYFFSFFIFSILSLGHDSFSGLGISVYYEHILANTRDLRHIKPCIGYKRIPNSEYYTIIDY